MPKDENIDVKERLLKAGLKIFAEKGYNGSTFRDICDEAGSNIASINYYFSDKPGFYFAVRDYARDLMREKMEHCWEVAATDPWKALRMHIDLLLDLSYDDLMFKVNWLSLREIMDMDNIPQRKMTPEVEANCRSYEEHMAAMMNSLLGDAATLQNRNLLRYTYHSLCQFLPIHRQIENKFHKGNGVFSIAMLDRAAIGDFIFDAVKRTVESMKANFAAQKASNEKATNK